MFVFYSGNNFTSVIDFRSYNIETTRTGIYQCRYLLGRYVYGAFSRGFKRGCERRFRFLRITQLLSRTLIVNVELVADLGEGLRFKISDTTRTMIRFEYIFCSKRIQMKKKKTRVI